MHCFFTIFFLTLISGLKIWMNQVRTEMYVLARWYLVLLITKASLIVQSCE
jgi:hypothetical protein